VKTPYLEVPDRQSDFVQSLRRALLSNGAHLAHEKGQSSAVVSIVRDNVTRRVVSVSATNQPNQYEVTYTVGFSVTAGAYCGSIRTTSMPAPIKRRMPRRMRARSLAIG